VDGHPAEISRTKAGKVGSTELAIQGWKAGRSEAEGVNTGEARGLRSKVKV
jgi:hypothetical protein